MENLKREDILYRLKEQNINREQYDTVCFLAKTDKDKIDFMNIYEDNDHIIGIALSKYKEVLREQGRGLVSFLEINRAYQNNNTKKLKELLSELFLEYINENRKLKILFNYIEKYDVRLEDVYNLHMNEEGKYMNFIRCVKKSRR